MHKHIHGNNSQKPHVETFFGTSAAAMFPRVTSSQKTKILKVPDECLFEHHYYQLAQLIGNQQCQGEINRATLPKTSSKIQRRSICLFKLCFFSAYRPSGRAPRRAREGISAPKARVISCQLKKNNHGAFQSPQRRAQTSLDNTAINNLQSQVQRLRRQRSDLLNTNEV